jgi:hypothetical protein
VAEILSGNCHYHPGRPGIGICVECKQVICQECTTQFDGINRCAACLAKMSRQQTKEPVRRPWGVGAIFGLIVSFGTVFGAVYFVSRLLSP